MDLIFFFRALLRRKWLLIAIPLLAAIVALVFTSDYRRLYKSTAQLSTGFTINEQVKFTDERFSLYEADVKFNNVIETLKSSKVIGFLSYDLMIHDLDPSNTPFRTPEASDEKTKLLSNLDLDAARVVLQNHLDSMELLTSFNPREKKLLELLKLYEYDYASLTKVLFVDRVKRTDYIDIQFFSESPHLSAYVVNTHCEKFLQYYRSLRSERSGETISTFSSVVDQKRKELSEKEEALLYFKSSERVLNVEAESTSQIEQIAGYEVTLSEARQKLQALTYSINDLSKRLNDISFGNQGLLASNGNAEILSIREQINDLNKEYINTGSKNEELLSRISDLRTQLQRRVVETSSNVAVDEDGERMSKSALINKKRDLEVERSIAQQNIATLEAKITGMKYSMGTYASKEARIAALEREVALASQEYLNAQEKYNTALNVNLSSGNDIKMTLEGQPAVEPEASKRLIITALASFTSLVLCVLSIIFLEYIDVSFKTPSHFKKQSGLDVIGLGNKLNLKKANFRNIFLEKMRKSEDEDLFRDLIRKMRFEIDNTGKKTILFTSSATHVGKSTIIHALSHALSLGKKKVLLIDTNFTHNSLTKMLRAEPALGNHLSNATEFVDTSTLSQHITQSPIPNVSILGCYGGNYSPSEVFPDSMFLSNLLATVKEQYDYVLLEGAALNQYTDAKELSKHVEGVIAVFAADATIKQPDHESIDFLKGLGDRFLGAILNRVDPENIDQ